MPENRSGQSGSGFHTLAFGARRAAEQAYEHLIGLGVSPDDLSLFAHAEPHDDPRREETLDRDIDVGGAAGAGLSALAGGASGLLAALGVLVIPGFGPLLAVGPVAAVLTGAIAGGAVGGFAGALAGAGVSEASALVAEQHLAAGRAIITVADAAWTEGIATAARRFPALIGVDRG